MPPTSLFVLSDLHLADKRNALEGFLAQQQDAFAALLQAALPGGSLGNPSAPMLILNGDTFDFLAIPPYSTDGIATPQMALEKLERIAATHEPFFHTLRTFLAQGGSVTFITGNHDIDLCFAEVRARVTELIDPTGLYNEQLFFCLHQFYQPVPDVWIEHGNQFDFWNHATGIWDEHGLALTPSPEKITLPLGTQYMQRASLPISIHYPYFDRFEPPLGIIRMIALLSLLDPEIVVQTARGVATMMADGHQSLQGMIPEDEQVPARLFFHAIQDFAAFQQEMLTLSPWWPALEAQLYSAAEREQQQSAVPAAFLTLHAALEQGLQSAYQAIFQPVTSAGDEDTARGLQGVLRAHPALHVAIAGHTHTRRADRSGEHGQLYLNTATWTRRLAPPAAAEVTSAVIDWLRTPDLEQFPLTDQTAFVFAWIKTFPDQPSTAHLCQWEGGHAGNYRILA